MIQPAAAFSGKYLLCFLLLLFRGADCRTAGPSGDRSSSRLPGRTRLSTDRFSCRSGAGLTGRDKRFVRVVCFLISPEGGAVWAGPTSNSCHHLQDSRFRSNTMMLSWVVKVVPQPPELPSKNTEDAKEEKPEAAPPPDVAPPPAPEKKVTFEDESKKDAAKADKLNQEVEASAGNGPGPGMLTWISSALPLPAPLANQNRANSTPKEEAAARKGMMAWISQGLEKVVPQPELRSRESPAAEQVQQAAAPAEAQSAGKELEPVDQSSPPSMMDWIKHGIVKVVPHPESLPKAEGTSKSEAPSKAPPAVPPPATRPIPVTEPAKEAEQQPNMVGWIVSGIGRMLPQPVPRPETGSDDMQNISGTQKMSDLVLEDLEEAQQQEVPTVKEVDVAEPLTPMDGVKKEAGDGAHMEERLQRLEAARVAEEMARQAAAEAVRQLEVERSARIVIETLPESNDQLPNILEEENEDEPECLVDVCPAEEKQVEALAPPTAPEPADQVTPSSTDVEPASERRDLESPITQQPEPHLEEAPAHTAEQSEAAAGEEEAGESGAPSVCSPVKSFLLRFPLAAECVERCRTLLQEHHLTPPTLSMLSPRPQLAQQLSQRAQQHCSSMASRFALPGFLSSLNRFVLQRRPPDT